MGSAPQGRMRILEACVVSAVLHQSPAETARTEAPRSSPRAAAQVLLGSLPAVVREPLEVAEKTRALSDPDRAVHALVLEVHPGKLDAVMRDPAALAAFVHDALFEANPDTRNPSKWDPQSRRWDPRLQSLSVTPISREEIKPLWAQVMDLGRAAGSPPRSELRAGARQLGEWLLAQPATLHLKVSWDNRDDTRFDGVLGIDARTGRVTVLMSNDFG